MLSIQDCIEVSELGEDEILAIAEHEHLPQLVAVEMGNYMVHTPEGEKRIKRMIVDDIAAARERGDFKRAATLRLAVKHFLQTHHKPAG